MAATGSAARSRQRRARELCQQQLHRTDVEKRGLAAPSTIKGNGEINPGMGGPIVRDRLWFFVSGQYVFADNLVGNQFFNANANQPNAFAYVRSSAQAIAHQDKSVYQGRFTYQLNQKNKLGLTIDQEAYCGCPFGVSATTTPDGANDRRFPLQRFVTADWTMPLTNTVLIEASGIHRVERWGGMHLQTGKGENIDAIVAGMTSAPTSESSDWRQSDLSVRHQVQQLVDWNIHTRGAELR